MRFFAISLLTKLQSLDKFTENEVFENDIFLQTFAGLQGVLKSSM